MIKVNLKQAKALPNVSSITRWSYPVLPEVVSKNDEVLFSTPIIRRLTDKEEIKELTKLFIDSLCKNLDKEPTNFIKKKLFIIEKKFLAIPFTKMSLEPTAITEAIKSNGKLLGGYTLNINPTNQEAYINFMVVSSEVKETKQSAELLLNMARRIRDNAKVNNIKSISWSTNTKNHPINRLMRRFNAQETKFFGGETKFTISLEDFSKAIDI